MVLLFDIEMLPYSLCLVENCYIFYFRISGFAGEISYKPFQAYNQSSILI